MFQAIAGLGAGVISGLLSARLGLPMTMEILLVFGMLSAIALLYVARKHYDEDFRRQGVLGEITLDIN
jgi:predicted ABC-type sugar transport system permease subunit